MSSRRQRFAGLLPGIFRAAGRVAVAAGLAVGLALSGSAAFAARPDDIPTAATQPTEARPAVRPVKPVPAARPDARPELKPETKASKPGAASDPAAAADRLKRINAARSWGYQLNGMRVDEAAKSPFDLLVADATTGHASGRHFRRDEVEALKKKPDGGRRLVVSYLSIGEAEDYRPDYFNAEYLTEDAPDWLMHENPQWKGNRLIRFCHAGWQKTILGDEDGRSVYNSIDPSPLYRLIELGFDGIYLDRVDVYGEVAKECPDGARKMVDFVARLAAHARKRKPDFLVILQNAEELVRNPVMLGSIDALAKEDLFYGADHSQNANTAAAVKEALGHLKVVKAAGKPVFVVDYLIDAAKKAEAKRRIEEQGFVPYIAPRDLGSLWLPGRDF